MYETPSQRDIQKIVITGDMVRARVNLMPGAKPELRAAS